MITRLVSNLGNLPQLEVAPDGTDLNQFTGRITVNAYEFSDTGLVLNPHLDINVSFRGRTTPDEAIAWAEAIRAAALIAKGSPPPWCCTDEYAKYRLAIDEIERKYNRVK